MKTEEKRKARQMRKQGKSINEIYQSLGVGKASVSTWVRDIQLTKEQKRHLSKKGHSKEVIEKRRATRLSNEREKRQKVITAAQKEIEVISKEKLQLVGIALYWAEGGKRNRGVLHFANSDPEMIEIMMKFFEEIMCVPNQKFRGHVNIHEHLDAKRAEKYWSQISKIPREQFYNTSQQHNKASKHKRDSLPHGTFNIYICDIKLFLKMKGWINGLYEKTIK